MSTVEGGVGGMLPESKELGLGGTRGVERRQGKKERTMELE